MNYEVFYSGCGKQVLCPVLGESWALFSLLRLVFPPSFWQLSYMHALISIQLNTRGGLFAHLQSSGHSSLPSRTLPSWLDMKLHLLGSGNQWTIPQPLYLLQGLKTSSRQQDMAVEFTLLPFPSFRDHCPSLPDVQCFKCHCLIYFVWIVAV